MVRWPAIDALPSEYREAVILSDIHDLRYAEIAESLGISEKTVEAHLSRIYAKVGVRSRRDLVKQLFFEQVLIGTGKESQVVTHH